MLNIGKLAHGGAEYYLASVASTVEAYYTGAGEAPGRWLGQGADRLGLSGLVAPETLRAVLAGTDPADGRPLAGPARTVPGFDLTFRAPKSVSLLWALGDEDTSREVRRAHDAAVTAALDYLERHAAFTRRGQGGVERVAVDGFVAAAFRHRTSRADDPLLHTHVLIANLAYTPDDGTWRSLDARQLYLHAKTAGCLYQAQLRADLGRRLQVDFGPVTNGYADVAGVPRKVIVAFSRRRTEILQRLETLGHHTARAAQYATLETRTAKSHADADGLRTSWRQRAATLGFGARDIAAITRPPTRQTPQALEAREDLVGHAGWLLGPAGLTAQTSTFTRREVLQGWCSRLTTGADVAEVEQLTDRLLVDEHPGTLQLTGPGDSSRARRMSSVAGIRLADGRLVASHPDEARYTTPELLAVEQQLIDTATARVDADRAVVPAGIVDATMAGIPLSGEQQHAAEQLTRSGRGVDVVVGRAGTGKTYLLGVARTAWCQANIEVVGCALAARAAQQLQVGSGIPSTTIDRLLAELQRPGGQLPPGGVLVIDEAGMVGTRTLARLLAAADATDTKLVLVGDHHQLPEIDAGGAFAALAVRLPAIDLADNRRQTQPWEIDALDQFRDGRLTDAIAAYTANGRITVADTADLLREQLVGDWSQARIEHGTEAIMIAARHADIDDLNTRARTRLAADGHLTGPALQTDQGACFQVGDQVLCLRNHRRLGVLNGTRGIVTHIDRTARSLTLSRDDNSGEVELPASYLDAGHLTHGYALTGHKAQGLTCDATFVLAAADIYRQWGYVALSRGRTDNRLYVTASELDPDPCDDPIHPEVHQHDRRPAVDRLTAGLRRSRRQALAVDHQAPASTDQHHLGIDEAVIPPKHLARALGPRPADPDRRQRWDTAAAAITSYRTTHGIDDEHRPLGGVPDDPPTRHAYRQAVRQLLAARRALRGQAPTTDRQPGHAHGRGRDVA